MRLKLKHFAAAVALIGIGSSVAWAAGMFSTLPIVGNGSFCASTVTGFPTTAGGLSTGGGITGQGAATGTSALCAQTVSAGPSALTGNELIPADTTLTGGAPPQTVTIPSGMLSSYGTNVLVGPDFGQALWQRGTTPISASTPTSSTYGPDGWYLIEGNGSGATSAYSSMTVSKQTGTTDVFPGTVASARIQRVASQTGTANYQFGQLVPDDSSYRFFGNTAIFSCYMLAGANFSPTASNVSMIIAYHSAADATTEAANAQGTNSGTFGTSTGTTQNITNYTEAVVGTGPISTTWTRYSVSAPIPTVISGTTTAVAGIGAKLQWVPTGTAGANDWLEAANCQLEARAGLSTGPSLFNRRSLAEEYALETTRYWEILENGNSATPIYATGQGTTTNGFNVMFPLPSLMRLTPVVSPITIGGFKINQAGTLSTIASLNTTGVAQTPHTSALSGQSNGLTAGQGTTFVGSGAGTGVLGFSAEP